jgi:hypothetical protein
MISHLNLISTPPHAAVNEEERRKTKAMAALPYAPVAPRRKLQGTDFHRPKQWRKGEASEIS